MTNAGRCMSPNRCTRFLLLVCVVLLLAATGVYGQFDNVINSPPRIIGDNESIGSNTQLNVSDGGSVGDRFDAGEPGASSENIEVNILGGTVGHSFEALDGSQVTISGGAVGNGFQAYDGSQVTISGGSVGRLFEAYDGSQVTISGGSVGNWFRAYDGSRVIISGGVLDGFEAHDGSQVTISGGAVEHCTAFDGSQVNISGGSLRYGCQAWGGSQVTISGGSVANGFQAYDGSQVTVSGGEFRLNGVAVEGLGTVGASVALDVPAYVLSGVLTDGTPFVFGEFDDIALPLSLVSSALPPVGPMLITASTDPVPLGIREGQTLVVDSGGVVGDNFVAGFGSTLVIEDGGVAGNVLKTVGAEVTISGGSVGGGFQAYDGSRVTISGGSVEGDCSDVGFYANGTQVTISGGSVECLQSDDSQVSISGGAVGRVGAVDSSHVTISGGSVGNNYVAWGGRVTITGGSVRVAQAQIGHLTISGGSVNLLWAFENSQVNLIGTEFFVDGELVPDLVVGEPATLADRDVTLSGHLADGSPFSFEFNNDWSDADDYFSPDTTLTLTLVPEPWCMLRTIVAILVTAAGLRKRTVR